MKYLGRNVKLRRSKYEMGKGLAIIMLIDTLEDEAAGYDYDVITVNLMKHYKMNRAFLDVNNYPSITAFIEENDLGHCIGHCKSGFVDYPLYEFNIEKIPEWKI